MGCGSTKLAEEKKPDVPEKENQTAEKENQPAEKENQTAEKENQTAEKGNQPAEKENQPAEIKLGENKNKLAEIKSFVVDPAHMYFIPNESKADSLKQLGTGDIKEKQAIVALFDPRQPAAYFDLINRDIDRSKLHCVFLTPSASSSPEHLVALEVWILCLYGMLGCEQMSGAKAYLVHADTWTSQGCDILPILVANPTSFVYPASQKKSIATLLNKYDQLWRYRAFVHWAAGSGFGESDISPRGKTKLKELLDSDGILMVSTIPDKPALARVQPILFVPSTKYVTFHDVDAKDLGVWKAQTVSEFKAEAQPKAPAICLVWKEDLKKASDFIVAYRKAHPSMSLCTVMVGEFESFQAAAYIRFMNYAIEETDAIIFVTPSELLSLARMFTDVSKNENLLKLLTYQQIPFPRIKLFTLSTAMGQELQDKEILTAPLSVGRVHDIPDAKFAPGIAFTGDDGKSLLVQRLVRTVDAKAPAATLIQPSAIARKLLEGMSQALVTSRESVEEELDPKMAEASSNVSDLISEFNQYAGAWANEPEEEEEE